jgi:hypothetical protein
MVHVRIHSYITLHSFIFEPISKFSWFEVVIYKSNNYNDCVIVVMLITIMLIIVILIKIMLIIVKLIVIVLMIVVTILRSC